MASSAVSSTSSISPSHRSPQAPVSHSPSPVHASDVPTLEVLVGHLLASKRSLNSVSHLHRASAIITEARSAIEATAIVSARSAFLRRTLAAQLKILTSVHSHLTSLDRQAQVDFAAVLKGLDEADGRLETALYGLKHTNVEHAFRPQEESQKTLLDFVDEKPVEEVRDNLRNAIDGLNAAMKFLNDETRAFEDDLSQIRAALTDQSGKGEDSAESFQIKEYSIAGLLHELEEHAREMAIGVESLVKHFDLCVTAIKHTEGGGAAAQNLASDLPEGLDMEHRDFQAPTQSISEEEHAEILNVLHNDASEVEEVVVEIQDRISEMELRLDQILSWKDGITTKSSNLTLALQRLEQLGTKILYYTSQTTTFLTTWSEEKAKIEEGMAGLEDLRDIYDNFLAAYDGLIIEVARRKSVKLQMEKIVRDAHAQLEKLYEEDMADREGFRQDQGDFLPSDIWPGLADAPVRFAITKPEDSGGSIPNLPSKTVEAAWKRLKGSQHMR